MTERKIVKVIWQDAWSDPALSPEELEERLTESHLAPYDAVGYLIREERDCLVICQAVLPKWKGADFDIFKQVLCIPKALIVSVEGLQPKKS